MILADPVLDPRDLHEERASSESAGEDMRTAGEGCPMPDGARAELHWIIANRSKSTEKWRSAQPNTIAKRTDPKILAEENARGALPIHSAEFAKGLAPSRNPIRNVRVNRRSVAEV